jgi:ArsR family transcriptional regulator
VKPVFIPHICSAKVQGSSQNKKSMRKTKVTFKSEHLSESSELMRALAHPLRIKILGFIDKHGTINVNKIYNTLKIEQSITSQHLRIMRSAGVLISERDGKFVHYKINYPKVDKAVKAINRFLEK